jgi:protein SCO1/2
MDASLMRRRDMLLLLGAGWAGGLALLVRPVAAHKEGSALTPAAGRQAVRIPAPDFTLTDQEGRSFALRSWRGRAVLVTFGFTGCVDACPVLAANLAVIQRKLPEAERTRTGFLLITTDPDHDRPAVLREYGARLGADLSTWKFLTGGVEELAPAWKAFGIAVKKRGPGQVDHTALATIVDREGIRRVNYYGTRWHPQSVMRELLSWARSAPMTQ